MNTTYALRKRPRRRLRLAAAAVVAAAAITGCVALDAATASSPHREAPTAVVQLAAQHDAPPAVALGKTSAQVTATGKLPHVRLGALLRVHRILRIHRWLYWRPFRRYRRWGR